MYISKLIDNSRKNLQINYLLKKIHAARIQLEIQRMERLFSNLENKLMDTKVMVDRQ